MGPPVNQGSERGRERKQDDHAPVEDDHRHGGHELQREDDRARRERDRGDSDMTRLAVAQIVANERKKPSETYRAYFLRIRAMVAVGIPHGEETTDSNNAASSSIISNAWYKHTDNLYLIIREISDSPLHVLDRVISSLWSLMHREVLITTTIRVHKICNLAADQIRSLQVNTRQTKGHFYERW
ncbi:hypothetical protein GN244_ATG14021 [Phytophthora infestans]|uniref:Uncharacterized protein n=1 Tax=Phytophthora infestans TaxID=4787 RepID=A0A833SVV2_PHYIN|nr:hypothetical protein GN244_ATG14020 [Phytophthora infestans]KAF4034031.1 hypothetical protein GN244_ATG14021 [Phytophthora infestans]